jgi:hypothetical protein
LNGALPSLTDIVEQSTGPRRCYLTLLSAFAGLALLLVLAGASLGLLGAFALTRFNEALLFQVQAREPLTLALAPVLRHRLSTGEPRFPSARGGYSL